MARMKKMGLMVDGNVMMKHGLSERTIGKRARVKKSKGKKKTSSIRRSKRIY